VGHGPPGLFHRLSGGAKRNGGSGLLERVQKMTREEREYQGLLKKGVALLNVNDDRRMKGNNCHGE